MKINEYNQMMSYLTRPGNKSITGGPKLSNAPVRKPNAVPPKTKTIQKFSKGGKPENSKILEYINDMNIVYGDKKSTKAELEAATKRVESYKNQMSKQDEYNKYFNKKSPKYYKKVAKIPVIPPKPDLVNGHSDWTTEDWLESVDPGGWVDDKKVEADSLYEKYLEMLKAGELLPGTTFQMFEKHYLDFDTDVISKIKKRVEDKKKTEGLAAILGVSPDRI